MTKEEIITFKPVIAVVGHVDHGKTTLLDAIRKTNITSREKGGITQSIGASEIEVEHEGKKRGLTLIDTPGHEAFANMRTQGVSAADIVLLVIAADDGIKPQTKESIEKIKEANIPYIVVLTKIDMPGANLEKVKQEATREGILLEGSGGNVPHIGVSGVKGEKIKELLDLIFLVYDIANIEKKTNVPFLGVVIDSKHDKKRGITASIIVKEGILKVQDTLFTTEKEAGKVRSLIAPNNTQAKEAYPGDAREILGITDLIQAGSALFSTKQDFIKSNEAQKNLTAQDLLARLGKKDTSTIKIVLKTQTTAEAEAVKNALPSQIEVITSGHGNITTSDVMRAKDSGSLLLGFNVNIEKDAKLLADSENVFYKSYGIIYELLDEIDDVAEAVAQEDQEKELGVAKLIAKFGEDEKAILGLLVEKGRLAIGDKIRLMRDEKMVAESKISSLRRGKSDVKEVARDLECGARLDPALDTRVGDAIIAYK